MHPLHLAFTVLLSLWALALSPAAPGVLTAVALMSAGLMLLRWTVQQILLMLTFRFSASRVGAQLALGRGFSSGSQSRGLQVTMHAYGLDPEAFAGMTPERRNAERDRLVRLLRDIEAAARLLPTGLDAPRRSDMRGALSARAGAAAHSYLMLFDAAVRAVDLQAGPASVVAVLA